MIRLRLLFLLLLALAAEAGTPKTYASIGDPIYKAVGPVRVLGADKTFRAEQDVFSAFAKEAAAAEKNGLWLDTHRMLPEAKARSDAYLKSLRHLQQLNAQIAVIVRDKLAVAMDQHDTSVYSAIKKSGYPALISDGELHRDMSRFEATLKREQERKQAQKAKREADYLRSYANLRGEWLGSPAPGKSVLYRFTDSRRLVIIKQNGATKQTLEGVWHIDRDTMDIALDRITNQRSDGVPHIRATDTKLSMQIRSIGKQKMTLFDTRRKTEITFLRYDNTKGPKGRKELQ